MRRRETPMTLEELRGQIDVIDETILKAFQDRMDVVAQVANAKKEGDLPVLDVARERQKLADITDKLPPGDAAVWLLPVVHAL
jgi:chorismate mutase/prephenate dehydratase